MRPRTIPKMTPINDMKTDSKSTMMTIWRPGADGHHDSQLAPALEHRHLDGVEHAEGDDEEQHDIKERSRKAYP